MKVMNDVEDLSLAFYSGCHRKEEAKGGEMRTQHHFLRATEISESRFFFILGMFQKPYE